MYVGYVLIWGELMCGDEVRNPDVSIDDVSLFGAGAFSNSLLLFWLLLLLLLLFSVGVPSLGGVGGNVNRFELDVAMFIGVWLACTDRGPDACGCDRDLEKGLIQLLCACGTTVGFVSAIQ